jgi:glycine betaine/proline transport system substrate-binding protein
MQRKRWNLGLVGLAVVGLIVVGCARAGATPSPTTVASTGASDVPASVDPGASPSAVAAATCEGAGDKGDVKMMVNEWVGAAANVAVAQCLLQQMGYKVTNSTLAEEVAWQGFETGDVDVILENWGHPDLEKKYIQDTKLAVDAGAMGVKGIIGWYVPKWMADKYPDITDWNNLNKYASMFKTVESGDKGQFLGASPAFVQYDEALIANLNLNYKVIFSGSEAASITAFQQATKNQTPLIGYFYDPQWLLNEIELVQIKLPPWTEGCDKDLTKVACDYPAYTLNKIVRTKWLDAAGDAGTFIKNFQWSNADQNSVADAITNKSMEPLDAAKVWIDANAATWQKWMP